MTTLKAGRFWWTMYLVLSPSSQSNQASHSSLCPSVKCCWVASSSLCELRAPGLQVHSLSAHYRWAQESVLTSHPPLGSLKPSAVPPPPPSSPSFSLMRVPTPHWSHPSSFDLQYLHHPPVPFVAIGNLKNAPPIPALSAASILLNMSQSVLVGGLPSHRALLPFGSLPCGGSDHSTVLTTRDLAPQPTVIEVTSQAIPWWIIKRPETELRVT